MSTNLFTIKEAKGEVKNVADVEVYKCRFSDHDSIHTDYIQSLDVNLEDMPDDTPCDYEVMDEEDYNSSILANSGETADFSEWYDDKDAKVLVVLLGYDFNLGE